MGNFLHFLGFFLLFFLLFLFINFLNLGFVLRRTWGTTGCESAEDETPRGSSHLKRKITTAKMNGIAAWQRHADVALEVPTAWQLAPHVHTQL